MRDLAAEVAELFDEAQEPFLGRNNHEAGLPIDPVRRHAVRRVRYRTIEAAALLRLVAVERS